MKSDLKEKLFSSVILKSEPDPFHFGRRRRRNVTPGAILSAALVIAAAAGLLMLLFQKIKLFL